MSEQAQIAPRARELCSNSLGAMPMAFSAAAAAQLMSAALVRVPKKPNVKMVQKLAKNMRFLILNPATYEVGAESRPQQQSWWWCRLAVSSSQQALAVPYAVPCCAQLKLHASICIELFLAKLKLWSSVSVIRNDSLLLITACDTHVYVHTLPGVMCYVSTSTCKQWLAAFYAVPKMSLPGLVRVLQGCILLCVTFANSWRNIQLSA